MYEYLNERFNRAVQWASSLAQLAFLIGGRMSVILFLPSLALAQVTGLDVSYSIILMGIVATLYTVFGGIKAVIWTDVLQTAVMVGGALACLIAMVVTTSGGVSGYVDVCVDHGKFEVFDFSWDLTLAVFWVFLIEGTFRGIVAVSEQPTMQRVFSTRTTADARKSVVLFAFLSVPGAMLFFGLGTALFAFYYYQPELVSPTLKNDAIFPLYIVQQLPAGVAGMIVAALFAASMSTLDSATNTCSALVVKDFYKPLRAEASEDEQLLVGRVVTIVVGILATLIGLWMAAQDLPSLFQVFSKLAGILGGGMPGVILLGLLTRRATSFGVLVGLVVSFVVGLLLPFTFVSAFLYVPIAIAVSFVVGYLASLLTPQRKDLTGLTVWTTRIEADAPRAETAEQG
jgi:SSS family transporter